MKKRHLMLIAGLALLIVLLMISDQEREDQNKEVEEVSQSAQRIPNSDEPAENVPAAESKTLSPLPVIVQKHIPTKAPKNLKGRFTHTSNFEDDRYIDTRIHLDGHPIDGYYFKWKKDNTGAASELVAGVMPTIERVNGSFPVEFEVKDIVNQAVGADGEILSTEKLWNLNSDRVLSPQAKVHVQTQSRSQRSSGSEYWFISLNTGKVVKRIEADRN